MQRPVLSSLSLAALCCLGASPALAQSVPAPAASASEPSASAPTQTIVINVSADASKAGLAKSYAGGQVARGGRLGLLGTQDMMDTPFSATAYTQALLQDQQTRSVGDALLNDAAVRNARGFGNFQELYVMRGFPVYSDDMAYNGLYGLLPRQYVASELLERVEVFRGASAFLNGAAPGGSGLGGAINLMPKRAQAAPLTEVNLGVESGGQAMLGLDVSRRFGPDQATGLRFNAVRRDGDTAVQGESGALSLLALGLDWHSADVRLSADLGWQDHRQDGARPSVTPLGAVPRTPSADTNFAQPWTYAKERETFGTVRGELDLSPDSLVWAAVGLRQGTEGNRLALISAAADGSASAYRYDNERKDDVTTGEVGWRGQFRTGPVRHEISASFSAYGLDSKNAYAFSNFAGFATDLYHPVAVAAPSADFYVGGDLDHPLTTERIETSSLALADTLVMLDERLRINLGARLQQLEDTTYDYTSGDENSHYAKRRLTPMVGLLYKLAPQWSAYGNYIEGLSKGDVAPTVAGSNTVTNGGQAMAPYRTRQVELGLKWDGGTVGGSLDVFQIRKPEGAAEDNGDGTSTYVVKDARRHRGVELNVFGEPMQGLKLLGGVSLIKAELLDSGKQAIGVPRTQFNLGTEWSPAALPDLALTLRWVHTGRQWADAANTHEVPAWNRWDIGARYSSEIAQLPVTWRLRVDNLSNHAYWASAGGYPGANYLVMGAPRTVTLGATVDF